MKTTQIGLTKEFPYCIRDGEVYCSTLCKNGKWERSPLDSDVKAFKDYKSAEHYVQKKHWLNFQILIPYKEWEEMEEE